MKNKKSKTVAAKASVVSLSHQNSSDFFVVGIGASAGGLDAFESFFSSIAPHSTLDMAFVIVQHLDPHHESLLTELLQRYTTMQVYEAKEGVVVEKNSVYVIPPNRDMRISKGALHLLEPIGERSRHLPINIFFHSLAVDKKNRAIGIVLSGTGHDGAQGLKDIKELGGTTFAQSLESSEYDGMPKSAIATGAVNHILAPQEMPNQLLMYANDSVRNYSVANDSLFSKDILQKIFSLLQSQTTHDFSMYKPSTIGRRIERRLVVNKIDTIEGYYDYLQSNEQEVQTLFNELLIGVTSFFRDLEVFVSLQINAIEKLVAEKRSGESIRVWIPGCSTGEEAYSIAILFMEAIESTKKSVSVQIFASDIDASAITIARNGLYPLSISENISQERLKNYFTKNMDEGSYTIEKKIRDMIVFSVHDVIKDPPFSRVDLISCRNLLIYMNVELQQKVLSLFHYALNPRGKLLLGSSETLGELASHFSIIDSKAKLFESKKNSDVSRQKIFSRLTPTVHLTTEYVKQPLPKIKVPLRELTENAILEQIAPAAVLVNEQGDILYIHGRASMYLQLPSGETKTNNILKMAREGLRADLTLAFHKATTNKQIVRMQGLQVKYDSALATINLTIRLVHSHATLTKESPLYLILLEEDLYTSKQPLAQEDLATQSTDVTQDKHIRLLKQELQLQKDFLQDANEKLETSNQELKLYNEEIQSINEELQSTNEELETSKEELQSLNEELSTVNTELNNKVTDLSRSNNDMNNLLSGTGIGTIFVDHKLNIVRFTPAVTRIINLIKSDIGRPVGHIVSNIVGYNTLVLDVESVLETLIPKEIEVRTQEDEVYLLRIQPYRTLENVIEGAVISFVDITEMSSMRELLKEADELSRLAVIVRDSSDAITMQDLQGNIIAWNPGAEKLYGWSETEALKMNVKERIPLKLQTKDSKKINELSSLKALQVYKTQRLKKDGTLIDVHVISSSLLDNHGMLYAVATTERPQNIERQSI